MRERRVSRCSEPHTSLCTSGQRRLKWVLKCGMDDSRQTRLEWMREEFQSARRRRLVKTSKPVAAAVPPSIPANPATVVVQQDGQE